MNKGRKNSNVSTNDSMAGDDDGAGQLVYVGNVTSDMSGNDIAAAFQAFGEIESITIRPSEASVPNGSQYAFVKFGDVSSAKSALNAGEVSCRSRTLRVRPRKRSSNWTVKHASVHPPEIIRPSHSRLDLRPYPLLSASNNLFSDSVSVANIPPDMSPQELYHLFALYGEVVDSFIFPYGRLVQETNCKVTSTVDAMEEFGCHRFYLQKTSGRF